MPTIAVLPGGITIAMYYYDHAPPHFHAKQADDEILVAISGLMVIGGAGRPAMVRAVLAWAAAHQAELAQCWARADNGQPPGRIS